MISVAERVLLPLDAVRGALLRFIAGAAPLRRVVLSRDIRVPVGLTLHATLAFAIALLIPSLSLVLAPIALGVPHLVSDLRYLVLRRTLPSSWLWTIGLFAGALFVLRLIPAFNPIAPDHVVLEHGLASSWVLLGALIGAESGGFRKVSALAVAIAILIAQLSLAAPHAFRLVLAHAHNLIGIALWLVLFRRSMRVAWIPVVLVLIGSAWLASGALFEVTVRHGILSVFGLHLFFAADWLAAGIRDAQGVGLASSFAFLQSVHYGIWLWAIPQDEGKAERTATFRMSWRSLRRDLHPIGLGVVASIVALVLVTGVMAPVRTQTLILSLGGFHAWLELATFVFLLARGDVTTSTGKRVRA